ncbi:GNAT family N-acetyltransferase [Falsibacillus pallidus]|uniref:Ribosomal protein S18 acetylase RimI-like enzyme n=1 Tax=Falsibacillus pallidus TaxID=493781 RepID=A0A370GGD1_9BACI|nr:GNAT family N-acetyltransferase [Falsibacillus pallidus]RDI42286.1 ribosomal protein S18 acetylase RimI-like enzyme [Falsibacillus pallidus]
MKMMLATENESKEAAELYSLCKKELLKKDIYQWDDNYPNEEFVKDWIEDKELYVAVEEEEIIGAVVLNEYESDEWGSVHWGNEDGNDLIIHALCVHPYRQGKGIGKELVQHSENIATEKGYSSIRLDAFSGNEHALKLYESMGYIKRGEVHFQSKPEGHQCYYCFDKILE